jgi:hypothetical protein
MTNEKAASSLEEDYVSGAPYQHLVELKRNATVLPGCTRWTADIVSHDGYLRRAVVNDGPAMSVSEMESYLGDLGAGGGAIWRKGNTKGHRHAGARASLLPWTDLLVLSWDAALLPSGAALRLAFNSTTGLYEMGQPFAPTGAELKLLANRAEVHKAGHGVMFIYDGAAGATTQTDGPINDREKNETDVGAADAMRDRIFSVDNLTDGTRMHISVAYLTPPNEAGGGRTMVDSNGGKVRLDTRVIKGHAEWTARTGDSGVVTVDELGTLAHWHLLPYSTDPSNRRLPFGGRGHIVARYKNESMILAAAPYSPVVPAMRAWGVSLADVADRLSLVIVPPDTGPWHVHQNPARSGLIVNDGSPLPVAQWAEAFVANMPKPILDANKDAAARVASKSASVKLSTGDRLRSRLGSRIKWVIATRKHKPGMGVLGQSTRVGTDYDDGLVAYDEIVAVGDRDEQGVEGLAAETRSGRKRRTRRDPHTHATVTEDELQKRRRLRQGPAAGHEVATKPTPIPEPVPVMPKVWDTQGKDPEHFASWDSAMGLVYFNTGHPLVREQVNYYSGEWLAMRPKLASKITQADVSEEVMQAYYRVTIGCIYHCASRYGVKGAIAKLTDEALTIAAHGFENVDTIITTALGSRGGRGGVVTPMPAATGSGVATTLNRTTHANASCGLHGSVRGAERATIEDEGSRDTRGGVAAPTVGGRGC